MLSIIAFVALGVESMFDITNATLTFQPEVMPRARIAATAILVDEVNTRCSQVGCSQLWSAGPIGSNGTIKFQLNHSLTYEGFRIAIVVVDRAERVLVTASSDRGFILASGRLLRELRMYCAGKGNDRVHLPSKLDIAISANITRGTQLTTASVGSWAGIQHGAFSDWGNAAQYVKELAIFGHNMVELSHIFWLQPSQDGTTTPVNGSEWESVIKYSDLLDRYDMNVALWLPISLPVTSASLRLLGDLFGNMTRLDSIHVPGGDGGPGLYSEEWFAGVRAYTAVMRQHHQQATVTCSATYFNATSRGRFFEALARPSTQEWLTGVSYGKVSRLQVQ
jgi:hypothetical protein